MAIRLGVNPKHADQMVRGTVALPHGVGKSVKILVFAKGEKEKEAREAGADFVGAEDLVEKITGGWTDFDKAIATPDMMGTVGKLGKILGPRGLMPNPKVGTVTFDVGRAVKELKAGRVEFKVDKTGIVHTTVGKISFDAGQSEGECSGADGCDRPGEAGLEQRDLSEERGHFDDHGSGDQARSQCAARGDEVMIYCHISFFRLRT